MSSKRAGLPSLNSGGSTASKKGALQPVKVQRYRAGKAPEGYVDPALQSSDEEENDHDESPSARRTAANATGGIHMSIGVGQEERKGAYQVLNVEQMTRERQQERAQRGGQPEMSAAAAGGDRRLARLQAMQSSDQRSRGDTRSRRTKDDSDEDEEEHEISENSGDDEEEAAVRRRKAVRAKALREEEEEELWGQGEEEDEEEEVEDSRRRGHGEDSEGSSEYTSGSEEESSDEDTPRRKLMKPVFVPKSQRITIDESTRSEVAEELAEKARLEEIAERKKESHQMLKEYVARQANVEEVPDVDNLAEVDDTDGLDEEAEFELWKLRELKRIKRDREELEARENEKLEIERRRELTEEERVKEDMAYLAKKAKEEQALKAAGSVEKYHHKGAFFMDSNEAILKRSTNEATPDAVKDIKALPKIMQVRNFGRAGQTKYTTLKDQDTSKPSGWSDPATRHLQQRHRMGGFRGDDYKIASSMQGQRGGRGRGGGGRGGGDRFSSGDGQRRDNANHTELGGGRSQREDGESGRRREYYDRDRDDSHGQSRSPGGDRDRARARDRERDRDRDRDRGDRGSSSRDYRDRDRDDGDSYKRRRH
ncbi:Microfibrillar-associated protein 1 [Mortierella hygrophila]|uniref:Microfibrillar-associated protein 1 n=1 Tax=Mortierella hygrophila TaxID=979708 RepID=A0A9P6F1C0_9FUNG|nr:Microfibrillar-associated protein 1 [Mortierella hygrophila]